MDSVFCRGCGQQIHLTAPACPHCGAPQTGFTPAASVEVKPPDKTTWMAIVSGCLGALAFCGAFDDSSWDRDTHVGFAMLAVFAIVTGVVSLSQRRSGKPVAVTGLVLATIGLLASFSHL